MVEKEGVDAQSVAVVGIFSAILVFVLILAAQVLYYRLEKRDEYDKFAVPGSTDLKDMLQEHKTQLSSYHWVDRQTDTVTIPVERAMDLVVRELQAKAPAPVRPPEK